MRQDQQRRARSSSISYQRSQYMKTMKRYSLSHTTRVSSRSRVTRSLIIRATLRSRDCHQQRRFVDLCVRVVKRRGGELRLGGWQCFTLIASR